MGMQTWSCCSTQPRPAMLMNSNVLLHDLTLVDSTEMQLSLSTMCKTCLGDLTAALSQPCSMESV